MDNQVNVLFVSLMQLFVGKNVKINDLKHNIERGQKGRHKKHVKKHEDALAKIEEYINSHKK